MYTKCDFKTLLGCHAVTTSFDYKIYLSIYTRVTEHILHVAPLGDVSRSIGWGGGGSLTFFTGYLYVRK